MRRILVLGFSLLFLLSCSSEDDSSNNNSTSGFNPPSWIQGTWIEEDASVETGFRFSSDNIEQLIDGEVFINYKEGFGQLLEMGTYTVEEVSRDDYYEFKLISLGATQVKYEFFKESNTRMYYPLGTFEVYLNKQ